MIGWANIDVLIVKPPSLAALDGLPLGTVVCDPPASGPALELQFRVMEAPNAEAAVVRRVQQAGLTILATRVRGDRATEAPFGY